MKFFHKKKSAGHLKKLFGTDPRKDWQIMLIAFTILNLLVVLWSGYLFWRIEKGNIFEVATISGGGAETATEKKLTEVLNIYNAREKSFEALRAAKPVTVDPGR